MPSSSGPSSAPVSVQRIGHAFAGAAITGAVLSFVRDPRTIAMWAAISATVTPMALAIAHAAVDYVVASLEARTRAAQATAQGASPH